MVDFLVRSYSLYIPIIAQYVPMFPWKLTRDNVEVKILKARVRDILDPRRDLGHTDRAIRQGQTHTHTHTQTGTEAKDKTEAEKLTQEKDKECRECQWYLLRTLYRVQ